MPFIKRLGFFLFGLSIGLIFLAIFLRKKSEETGTSFCYLPNCRVLKDIRSKQYTYSEEIRNQGLDALLDSATVQYFFTEGDIDFGASNTEAKPCKSYVIEGNIKERAAILQVQNCDSLVVLQSLQY
ncbi:MAG: DUF4258 domain-containing protein [Flavobacteriaceae bacterium]|nr:DUF4258 domain-containing protein [Flavobacteriaceae bacterium]